MWNKIDIVIILCGLGRHVGKYGGFLIPEMKKIKKSEKIIKKLLFI